MWFIQSTKSVPETLGPKSYNDLVLLPNNSAGVFFTWEANQKPTLFKLSHASNPEPAEYFCWFVYLEPKSLIVAPKPIVSCPKTRRASHCGNALKASKKPTEHKIMQSLFRRLYFSPLIFCSLQFLLRKRLRTINWIGSTNLHQYCSQ